MSNGLRVIIMVGAPGSGKSTRIGQHLSPEYATEIVSADHYFVDANGGYCFDRSKLQAAHQECQLKFYLHLKKRVPTIIVDNTNTVARDRKFYVNAAREQGYSVWIDAIECDAQTCFKRNIHGVPLDTIERMISRIDVPYGFYELPSYYKVDE